MILLIEINANSDKTATVASYAIEGREKFGPFHWTKCPIESQIKKQYGVTRKNQNRILNEVMDLIAPSIVEVWPDYLNFDNVVFLSNYKPLAQHMSNHGANRRWFTLHGQRPFDETLTEKWAEIKRYEKKANGELSKRAKKEYVRLSDFTPPKPKAKPLPLLNETNEIDWMTPRYPEDISRTEHTIHTCYNSFKFVEKRGRNGNSYLAIVPAPCPISTPFQAVDRLCYPLHGFRCQYEEELPETAALGIELVFNFEELQELAF